MSASGSASTERSGFGQPTSMPCPTVTYDPYSDPEFVAWLDDLLAELRAAMTADLPAIVVNPDDPTELFIVRGREFAELLKPKETTP
jgi:hypothetical protein